MATDMIRQKLKHIYEDLSTNVTYIYDRYDLMTAVDLVFHSVLRFKFRGNWVNKGWVECLIIGDTREGKSDTITKLIHHYKAGEFATGETTSYAGLLGGMQQSGKKWAVNWGKIPLNDRRLLAIDEFSGMPEEQISLLTGVRSSGIAQITKIQTEKTFARTRLIFISNTRSGRKLETYSFGILAVKELMGKTEDISRLDFAITIASGEVSSTVINRGIKTKVPHVYTSDACSALITWAWTRGVDDIIFSDETEEAILDYSEELSKSFSPSIPLVQPAEQRIKLARLSVALAARLFSTDDGKRVLVLPEHAEYIKEYLNHIYRKSSMGYDIYTSSMNVSGRDQLSVPTVPQDLINDYLDFTKGTVLTDILLTSNLLKKAYLVDALGWEKEKISEFLSWAIKNKLLNHTSYGFAKSATFNILLKLVKTSNFDGTSNVSDAEEPPFSTPY